MTVARIKELLSAVPVVEPKLASGRWYVATDGHREITIARGSFVELLISDCHSSEQGILDIVMEEDAQLRVVHVVESEGSRSSVNLRIARNASCRMTEVIVVGAEDRLSVDLEEDGANFEHSGLFIFTNEERGGVEVLVRHNSPNCTSHTSMRGVASGSARGGFKGLVYVAPDAQKTDSVQSSKNIVIGDAKISTEPQLEIYADDVKCSHGATVGQMDAEAVMYMRQRGLSLADAKRLQIEGFLSDVVMHAAIDTLAEPLQGLLAEKFNSL